MSELLIGFTGTRDGMKPQQKHRFVELIDSRIRAINIDAIHFVHGGAIGSDEQADELMIDTLHRTHTNLKIEIYPASAARYRYWMGMKYGVPRIIHAPEEPLVRNCKIVNMVTEIYATPAEFREIIRSGTWSTIRYARKTDKGRTIIFPDGQVKVELNSKESEQLR